MTSHSNINLTNDYIFKQIEEALNSDKMPEMYGDIEFEYLKASSNLPDAP